MSKLKNPLRATALALIALSGVSCTPATQVQDEAAKQADASRWAEACGDGDEWDKPGPPFPIYGNSYYVGTCGIAAILITSDQGHVLIDSGTEAGAKVVAANIAKLGFRLEDVELLLQSHEHFDHVGGTAYLQGLTGARLAASPAAAPVMASGISAAKDPQAGMHEPFTPARVDAVLGPAMKVTLGPLTLTALATPGHTPGALSWQWQSCEEGECRSIVYADSLSPVSSEAYKFTDHPAYLAAYRAGLGQLAALDCDILLTPHPSASEMRKRLLAPQGLADSTACAAYAASVGTRLDTRLAEEKTAKAAR